MSTLTAIFESKQPRERSGGWTLARYGFQIHFAILEILEIHKSNHAYCVLFDYFDDMVVLGCLYPISDAKFYQVKAKATGSWSAGQISRVDKAKPAPTSVIGKIQHNMSEFGAFVSGSVFVSNASFKMKLKTGKHSVDDDFIINASELHNDEIKKFDEALDYEAPPPRTYDCKTSLSFKRIALGTHEQHHHVTGAIAKFLADRKQNDDVPAIGVYETLKATIFQKSSVTKTLKSMDEIVEQKGLLGKDFESLINRAIQDKRFLEDWSLIQGELLNHMSAIQVVRMKTECIRFIRARANGDSKANALSRNFRRVAQQDGTLFIHSSSFLEARDALLSKSATWIGTVGDFEKAAALVEAYEEVIAT